MAEEGIETEDAKRLSKRHRIARGLLYTVSGLMALVALLLLALDTPPGRRFIIDRIEELEPANGLRIRIGRIDGSIYSNMTISDLRLYDPEGLFFEAPEMSVQWDPFAFPLVGRLHIDALRSPLAILHKPPELIPPEEERPFLPDFDIFVGVLEFERLRLDEPVLGTAYTLSLGGNVNIRRGRAEGLLRAAAPDEGDRMVLAFDAEPDGERFAAALRARTPEDGIVAGLTGIARPLDMAVAGDGSWQDWSGYALVDSGDIRAVDLSLEAQDGDFELAGLVRSNGLLDGGTLLAMTAPETDVSAQGTFAEDRLNGSFALVSSSARVDGRGLVDFGRSLFEGLAVDMRLLRPESLVESMSGSDIRLAFGVNGPFESANYRYQLTAPRIAFDDTGFEAVRVTGQGRLGDRPFILPVSARIGRVTGLGEVEQGIMNNSALDGQLAIGGGEVVGRDLRLRSDRARGVVSVLYQLDSGNYLAGVDATVDGYRVAGLGTFDVRGDVEVRPAPGGSFAVAGRAGGQARSIDIGFFETLMGGMPRFDANVRYDRGGLEFTDSRLAAPAMEFGGRVAIDGDGQLTVSGSGRQAQYGAFEVEAAGPAARPRVELALEEPVPAAGVSNVAMVLEPSQLGYAIDARGDSVAGPFTADAALLLPQDRNAALAVERLDVSDTVTRGRIEFVEGAMVGSLELEGSGLQGDIELLERDGEQVVAVDMTGENARIGGEIDSTAREIMLDLEWRPQAERLTLRADFALTGFRRRDFSLANLEGTAGIVDGSGTVDADLAGARGRNFEFSAHADIAPDQYAVNGSGSFRGAPIELSELVLRREEEGWVVPTSTLRYRDGSASVAARFGGPRAEISATMDDLPLSLVDIFYPDTGLGGRASGTLEYIREIDETVPTVTASLGLRSLTRQGFAVRPRPVNLGINARLADRRLAMRAIMESDGEEILRAQARLDPISGEGNLGDLIAAAPLFAELRYGGPAETLWQLTGIETLSLSGGLFAGVDVSGTLDTPRVEGTVETRGGRIESALTGTVIEGIDTRGTFEQAVLDFPDLRGTTPGGGSVSGRARFDLGLATGLGMDIAVEADRAWLLRRDDISARVSGPLTIELRAPPGTAAGTDAARPEGTIAGEFDVIEGTFMLGRATPSVVIPELNVTEINQRIDLPDPREAAILWTLDIDADARNRFMVRGLGLDSEWAADLEVSGSVESFGIFGDMTLQRGTYQFAGRTFDLERGRIEFYGNQPIDPSLDIVAGASAEGLDATITIGGTGNSPDISFASSPALPESEILSRLLFGTSVTDLTAPEAIQLAAALASLRGGGGGLNPINSVRDAIGLDRLRIVPADPAEDRGTAVAAGVYVTRNLYVEVITDGEGYSATELEFRITRWLSLLGSISTIGRADANLQISRDY